MSHSLQSPKWAEWITTLAQKEIQCRTVIKRKTEIKNKFKNQFGPESEVLSKAPTTIHATPETEVAPKDLQISVRTFRREPIPAPIRKAILQNDQCCQFKDPISNHICGSTRFLEIDHIQPIWAGGDNAADNLRILCSAHNKFKYAQQSGRSFNSTRVLPLEAINF